MLNPPLSYPPESRTSATSLRSRPSRAPRHDTVCQLLHSMEVGGAEMLADRLARGLAGEFRIVFACLDRLGSLGERLRQDGFETTVLDRRPGFDFACAGRLADFCRREKVGLIHAHQYTPFSYALVPRHFRRRPPILFTEHGRWHPDFPRRKRIWFNRLFLRRRDRVVAVGGAVRQALIVNEGIAGGRVEVVYNGADLSNFTTDAGKRKRARAKLGLADDQLAIVQVARLDPLKDHETGLRALARVAKETPSVRLLLVGEGERRAAIEREIDSLGLEKFVRLLGARSDVAELLPGADIFLLSSISEGIPVTLIEAMGCELPIAATAVGGMEEVVIGGRTGLLTPARDDRALADSILRLAGDPKLRTAFGAAGRARAEEIFAESQMHAAYRRAYREMLHV